MNKRLHFKKLVWTVLTVIVLTGLVGCGTNGPTATVPPTGAATQVPTTDNVWSLHRSGISRTAFRTPSVSIHNVHPAHISAKSTDRARRRA
jgi:hypothetical protein